MGNLVIFFHYYEEELI